MFGPLHRGEEPFSFCKRDEKCQKVLVQIAHHLISCAHLLHDVRMIFLHFHRMGQRGCNDEHLRELFQLRTERCQFSEVKRDRTVWTGGFANHVLKKKKNPHPKMGQNKPEQKRCSPRKERMVKFVLTRKQTFHIPIVIFLQPISAHMGSRFHNDVRGKGVIWIVRAKIVLFFA